MKNLAINAWAEEDRPREKLLLRGSKSLTDSEIIAILIGSGSMEQSAVELARDILRHYSNDLGNLAKASIEELMQFKGIGEAKAVSIAAALELGRRRKETTATEKPVLRKSSTVFEYMKQYFQDLQHEEFWIILLDGALKPMRVVCVGRGGVSNVMVDPKVIFKPAIESLCTQIILCHNHPSGKLKPSDTDIQLTKKLKNAAELLDIRLADHLIFTDEGFFSFSDEDLVL